MTSWKSRWTAWGMVVCLAPMAWATDITGVQYGAFDQPRINGLFRYAPDGDPIAVSGEDVNGDPVEVYDVQFFLDTGTSGILLSQETAQALGINRIQSGGQDVVYSDIGVAGSEDFGVSGQYYMSFAPFYGSPFSTVYEPQLLDFGNTIGPTRTQITLQPVDPSLFQEPLDLVGMPALQNKVVVFDPKPVNSLGYVSAFIYNPNTPFNPETADTNPGIPNVDHHVRVSEVDFSGFTQVTPNGAPGPTLASNPMIGPNPFDPSDTTPPVNITLGGHSASGSFLFDTGAQASFISTDMASQLGVHYVDGTYGTDNAQLVDEHGNPLPNQFQAQFGGIGGTLPVAGFYLDSLTLATNEGDPINYLGAPVLVADVSAEDADGNIFTFDGDFGVNFWIASTGNLGASASPYSWVTFDVPNNLIGFQFNPATMVPEPASALLLLAPFLFMLNHRRRRA